LTAQSADFDLALERDQRAQGFVNHPAFVSNAGHPSGALDEFTVNVNMHIVGPLYTCAGRVRLPARGTPRMVGVIVPARRVACQRNHSSRTIYTSNRMTPSTTLSDNMRGRASRTLRAGLRASWLHAGALRAFIAMVKALGEDGGAILTFY
jgi:hypothetical protein